jgi:S-DNA-T family DNA segregation ATPase FtsK/SpoIIIE
MDARRKEELCDIVQDVFDAREIPVNIQGTRELPSFIELMCVPGRGVDINAISRQAGNISVAIGIRNIRIAAARGYVAIQVPLAERRTLKLTDLLSRDLPTKPTFVLGQSEEGNNIYADLSSPDVAHVGIFGTTGSGKTNLLHCMVGSLCYNVRPSQVGIVLLDPKRRDPTSFMRVIAPHLLAPPCVDTKDMTAVLHRCVAAMEQRVAGRVNEPRIVIVVDELTDCIKTGGDVFLSAVQRIAARGREVCVHLIMATQYPTAQAVSSILKANIPLRLVGRMMSKQEAVVAAGVKDSGAEGLPGRGSFVAVAAGRIIRFDAPVFDLLPERDDIIVDSTPTSTDASLPSTVVSQEIVEYSPDADTQRVYELLRDSYEISGNQLALKLTDGRSGYAGMSVIKRVDTARAKAERMLIEEWTEAARLLMQQNPTWGVMEMTRALVGRSLSGKRLSATMALIYNSVASASSGRSNP